MMIRCSRLQELLLAAALFGGTSLAGAGPMIPATPPSFVSVQTTDPLASEPGNNPGSFSISRGGDTNAALTVAFSLGGTATNGVDYASIPTFVTLAAGQVSASIAVTPISEPKATGYKTVILTLTRPGAGKGAAPAFTVGSLNRALVYIAYNYTNVPPSVSLVTPTNGASFLSKPNIALAARASDSNGWVTAVEFIANGQSVGTS